MANPFIADGYRVVVLGFVLVFGGAAALADTIVLKNGRRILAFNVVEAGEKIRYETNAGELSLPKSIVDHIEKGGAVPMGGPGGANAANLAITPPAMDAAAGGSGGEIERRAVHDGAIDREYIAKLEGATQEVRLLRDPRRELMLRWGIMRRRYLNWGAGIWITRWAMSGRR